jgi:hypothetical protein
MNFMFRPGFHSQDIPLSMQIFQNPPQKNLKSNTLLIPGITDNRQPILVTISQSPVAKKIFEGSAQIISISSFNKHALKPTVCFKGNQRQMKQKSSLPGACWERMFGGIQWKTAQGRLGWCLADAPR